MRYIFKNKNLLILDSGRFFVSNIGIEPEASPT
jgi:hypothetical protein